MKPHTTKFWVTYGSNSSPFGKVHKLDCRYSHKGYGRELAINEIKFSAPRAEDCKVCGGAT